MPHYQEAAFVKEPATVVIESLGNLSITGNPKEFCKLCIDVSLSSELEASNGHGLIIQDRSMIDTIAYARRDNCEDLLPQLDQDIALANYSAALICSPISGYKNTITRYEDQITAMQTHELLVDTYEASGLPLVHLSEVDLDLRILEARSLIDQFLTYS